MSKGDLVYNAQRKRAFRSAIAGAIEVRSDRMSRQSGHIFIEPSEALNSPAPYWAFETAEDRWTLIPTKRLREILVLKDWRKAGAGEAVLIPISAILLDPETKKAQKTASRCLVKGQ